MNTVKLFTLSLLMLFPLNMSGQTTLSADETRKEELRQRINIDYSVPDFNTKKIDGKVIGVRLAKMLIFLEKNYQQGIYNRMLSAIRSEQVENPRIRFAPIAKMKVQRISKTGDDIFIVIKTTSKIEGAGKLDYDVTFSFTKGVSESIATNDLFCDLSTYIKED